MAAPAKKATPAKRVPAKQVPAKRAAAKKTAARRPATAKAPTDRQPKAVERVAGEVTFWTTTTDRAGQPVEREWVLAPITEGEGSKVPGEITYDAVMDPHNAYNQLRVGFAILSLRGGEDSEVLAALKSLTTDEMVDVVLRWMGESQGSSA